MLSRVFLVAGLTGIAGACVVAPEDGSGATREYDVASADEPAVVAGEGADERWEEATADERLEAEVVEAGPVAEDTSSIRAVRSPEVKAEMATAFAKEQAPERYRASEVELSVWNSEAFQRDFALSYKAETEIEPPVTLEELETMQRVLDYISDDRADKALKLLRKNLDDSSSAVFDFTLANIHFQAEELDEAAAAYRSAVEKYPKFRRAYKNLGLIHVRRSEFEKAVPALTRVLDLGGGDSLTYGLLGYSYSNVENHVSAESAYRMATLLDPLTADWREGLALSFFKQERFADAAALCGTMIKGDPGNASLWLLQGNAYIGLDQPLRAAENFEFVDTLGKSTPDSLFNLGDIYVNEELFGLGVATYVRALEMDADAPVDRPLRAAKVLSAQGALEETRHLAESIAELRGDDLPESQLKELKKIQSRIAVAEGDSEEEARVLEEIVALDPLDGEALILLGQHARRNNDEEKAIFYYERAAAIEGHEADAKVRHAQLLAGRGEYKKSIELLERAQTLKPRENVKRYLEQVKQVMQGR